MTPFGGRRRIERERSGRGTPVRAAGAAGGSACGVSARVPESTQPKQGASAPLHSHPLPYPVQPPSPLPSPIHHSYYHGRISRDAAVDALTDRGVDGSFLLRMSESQDGVYTISVMCVEAVGFRFPTEIPQSNSSQSHPAPVHETHRQGSAVRHIRVINTDGGYALSHGDPPEESVWSLIESQMHKSLTNTVDASDAVSLRLDARPLQRRLSCSISVIVSTHSSPPPMFFCSYPLPAAQEAIAPDLLNTAGEAGMDASEFDDDVAAFLEGAVRVLGSCERRRDPSSPYVYMYIHPHVFIIRPRPRRLFVSAQSSTRSASPRRIWLVIWAHPSILSTGPLLLMRILHRSVKSWPRTWPATPISSAS